jgi:hypothetical protein
MTLALHKRDPALDERSIAAAEAAMRKAGGTSAGSGTSGNTGGAASAQAPNGPRSSSALAGAGAVSDAAGALSGVAGVVGGMEWRLHASRVVAMVALPAQGLLFTARCGAAAC